MSEEKMNTYSVRARFYGTKIIGKVEGRNEAHAEQKAWDLLDDYLNLPENKDLEIDEFELKRED